ncbi:SPFH domain-containing protein [Mycolicibacterium mucogenicum]|nr:SPFH domain-containing protein [Mycolicibacterium mucogenicum]KAB7753681.1 hypothetical protein MMUC44124_24150 [Mycolicibacterium mucogenicum DSM 44124]QPG68914.1 SPFH domain-containing protein [Mycolicibacterium mucogenicum DSM 44124]
MPVTFILSLICLLIGAVALAVWAAIPYTEPGQYRDEAKRFNNPYAFLTSVGGAVLALVFVICASANIIGPRQVGIVTSFNRPTGETLSNGLHFMAPWKNVVEMDAAIQNDVYNGDRRIQVRLGNNSTALADVNIRWNIKSDKADELYRQYKTFDNVRSNLIERNLRTALNEAFVRFDPLAGDPVAPIGPDGKPTGPAPARVDLNSVTTESLRLMREKSGDQVEIIDLSIPVIDYDDNTEKRINAINAARAETTQAEQDAKTAEQRRIAAEALARQPVPDLKIAIAACLNKMAQAGVNLNCFPIGDGVLPTLSIPSPVPGR